MFLILSIALGVFMGGVLLTTLEDWGPILAEWGPILGYIVGRVLGWTMLLALAYFIGVNL